MIRFNIFNFRTFVHQNHLKVKEDEEIYYTYSKHRVHNQETKKQTF